MMLKFLLALLLAGTALSAFAAKRVTVEELEQVLAATMVNRTRSWPSNCQSWS